MTAPRAGVAANRRRQNTRGRGEQLREEIVVTATGMLDELADDQALSLRAVARAVSIAATSVYLYFPDRDALVLAIMRRCHDELVAAAERAGAAGADPATRLRRGILAQAGWAGEHPGLYKVLHESEVNRRLDPGFAGTLVARTTTAVRECMDAGLAPVGDAGAVALDLRCAVIGMLSMRINQPGLPWPPVEAQLDRFLDAIVGLAR
jgi:AcrR family transcriptional regulator